MFDGRFNDKTLLLWTEHFPFLEARWVDKSRLLAGWVTQASFLAFAEVVGGSP